VDKEPQGRWPGRAVGDRSITARRARLVSTGCRGVEEFRPRGRRFRRSRSGWSVPRVCVGCGRAGRQGVVTGSGSDPSKGVRVRAPFRATAPAWAVVLRWMPVADDPVRADGVLERAAGQEVDASYRRDASGVPSCCPQRWSQVCGRGVWGSVRFAPSQWVRQRRGSAWKELACECRSAAACGSRRSAGDRAGAPARGEPRRGASGSGGSAGLVRDRRRSRIRSRHAGGFLRLPPGPGSFGTGPGAGPYRRGRSASRRTRTVQYVSVSLPRHAVPSRARTQRHVTVPRRPLELVGSGVPGRTRTLPLSLPRLGGDGWSQPGTRGPARWPPPERWRASGRLNRGIGREAGLTPAVPVKILAASGDALRLADDTGWLFCPFCRRPHVRRGRRRPLWRAPPRAPVRAAGLVHVRCASARDLGERA
jgi:hypothetical protein